MYIYVFMQDCVTCLPVDVLYVCMCVYLCIYVCMCIFMYVYVCASLSR